jgi:hypothetical protein
LTLQGFARCRAGRAHFSTTNGSNFNKWGAASPQIFLAGIIRVHWGYSWFKDIRARSAQGVGSLIDEVAARVSFTVGTTVLPSFALPRGS